MKTTKDELIDKKGRSVRMVKRDGGGVGFYYQGRDAEGLIEHDEGGEFIVFNGEKRHWGGIIDPLPDDGRIQSLRDFTLFSVKPDGVRIGIVKMVEYLIKNFGGEIAAQKDVVFNETLTRKMYPYFFTEEWERELIAYMTLGPSHCFLVTGTEVHRGMYSLRNSIRRLFGCYGKPVVANFVHCSEGQIFAVQESLLFFTPEELIRLVGLKKGDTGCVTNDAPFLPPSNMTDINCGNLL